MGTQSHVVIEIEVENYSSNIFKYGRRKMTINYVLRDDDLCMISINEFLS